MPALNTDEGVEFVGKPASFGLEVRGVGRGREVAAVQDLLDGDPHPAPAAKAAERHPDRCGEEVLEARSRETDLGRDLCYRRQIAVGAIELLEHAPDPGVGRDGCAAERESQQIVQRALGPVGACAVLIDFAQWPDLARAAD